MRRSRIYTDQPLESAIQSGERVTLEQRSHHYLRNVLRLKAGDELTLFDGSGEDYSASAVHIDKKKIEVVVTTKLESTVSESPLHTILAIGVSRGDKMDFALQKAVELGVSEIQPLVTERVNSYRGKDALHKKMEHWRGVVISACEQSGRRIVPNVLNTVSLNDYLSSIEPDEQSHKLIFTLDGKPLLEAISKPGFSRVSLLIGPEGGLSEVEISEALRRGFSSVRLGPRVLRTETAPLAALAVLQALHGDLA